MKKKNNLTWVHLLDSFLRIAIVIMYAVVLIWTLILVYNYYKERNELRFILEIPFYFEIKEELELVEFADIENIVEIKQANGKISMDNPPARYFWFFLIAVNLYKSAIIILAMILLRKITSNFLKKNTFHISNSKYIRQLGILLIVYSISMSIYKFITSSWFSNQLSTSIGRTIKFELNFEIIIIGLFAILLAGIFNYGAELQEEKDLTI